MGDAWFHLAGPSSGQLARSVQKAQRLSWLDRKNAQMALLQRRETGFGINFIRRVSKFQQPGYF